MDEYYNKHYICIDVLSNIINGWSDGPHSEREVTEADILLNDKGGYQFRLILDGVSTEENPPLFDWQYMIPLYKWDGSQVLRRTEAEMEADREVKRREAEEAEKRRIAEATETVLLEMAADHEERLCMIEMGVDANDL